VLTPGQNLSGGSFDGTTNVTWNVTGSILPFPDKLVRRSEIGDVYAGVYYGDRFEGAVAELGSRGGAGTAGLLVGANTEGQARIHFLDKAGNIIGAVSSRENAPQLLAVVGDVDCQLKAGNNIYTGVAIVEGGRDAPFPIVFRRQLTVIARIDSGGNYQVGSGLATKRDVAGCPRGLEEVLQMRPVTFCYKFDSDEDPQRVGFIAEELKEVIPEAVQDNEEGISYSPSSLIPVLVKAIQDLTTRLQLVEEVITQ
jgi:hypothetical protein